MESVEPALAHVWARNDPLLCCVSVFSNSVLFRLFLTRVVYWISLVVSRSETLWLNDAISWQVPLLQLSIDSNNSTLRDTLSGFLVDENSRLKLIIFCTLRSLNYVKENGDQEPEISETMFYEIKVDEFRNCAIGNRWRRIEFTDQNRTKYDLGVSKHTLHP